MISEEENKEGQVGYNCEYCIAKEFMGTRKGRICFYYQIDFNSDVLEYSCSVPEKTISGEVTSIEEFQNVCSSILELYKADRIEIALKQFRIKNTRITGICAKSFPKTQETVDLLSLINLCTGGQSGTELFHLPYSGTILDQPNKFIEAYFIFCNEFNKHLKRNRHKDKANEAQRQR